MLAFDIGANRGDWTVAALAKGYDVVALEPGKILNQLIQNFIYNPKVMPLKMAVSSTDFETVEFYEAEEDGLSTLNKDWLTAETMPYAGKPYIQTFATTITLDTLAVKYGTPDLIKIDVEGGEWNVLRGLHSKMGMIAFEWTDVTIKEHNLQLKYLLDLGYTKVAPQFIVHHCEEPADWYDLAGFDLADWVKENASVWVEGGWQVAGLRPTADVGMVFVK